MSKNEVNEVNEKKEETMSKEIKEEEQERINEVAVTESNDAAITEEDLSGLSEYLGTSISEEDQLEQSVFIQKNPKIGKLIKKFPNITKASDIVKFIDSALYSMGGDDRYVLNKITLVKKMNMKSPEFQIGTFKKADAAIPIKQFKFFPLISYNTRVYFPKAYDAENPKTVCGSTNNFKGLFTEPSPYIKECKECPFQKWGSQEDGSVDPSDRSRPLCRTQVNIIGITDQLDGLYELVLNGYCLAKKGADAFNKMQTAARMLNFFQPEFEGLSNEEKVNYRLQQSRIDSNSFWLQLSGVAIENKSGTDIVSAATVVESTKDVFTNEELLYAAMYRQFAMEYINYTMENFHNYLLSSKELSASDTNSIEAESTVVEQEVNVEEVIDVE